MSFVNAVCLVVGLYDRMKQHTRAQFVDTVMMKDRAPIESAPAGRRREKRAKRLQTKASSSVKMTIRPAAD